MDLNTVKRTILLADDDGAIRTLAAMFLEREGYAVLTASDGAEAFSLFRRSQESIALLISDVTMPKMNGLELAAAVRTLRPRLPVILISGNTPNADCGWGCIAKPFTSGELAERVRQALAENAPQAPIHAPSGRAEQRAEPLSPLTKREFEVLQLVCHGYSNKVIGAKLGITLRTAACHRSRILDKAGVHETASLVRFALRAGYIEA
jgi:DNA-binding NarL/FixJ family response regulator